MHEQKPIANTTADTIPDDWEPAAPPLKRHATIQPLSREHMGALILARNLLRDAEGDLTVRHAATAAFVKAWQDELHDHFADEERLLLPLTNSAHLRDHLLAEHEQLNNLGAAAAANPATFAAQPLLLRHIGTILYAHVRWEERVFFETVQHDHPEKLAALLGEAEKIHTARPGSRPRIG